MHFSNFLDFKNPGTFFHNVISGPVKIQKHLPGFMAVYLHFIYENHLHFTLGRVLVRGTRCGLGSIYHKMCVPQEGVIYGLL